MFDKYYVTLELFTCHTLTFPNIDSYLINITLSESYCHTSTYLRGRSELKSNDLGGGGFAKKLGWGW